MLSPDQTATTPENTQEDDFFGLTQVPTCKPEEPSEAASDKNKSHSAMVADDGQGDLNLPLPPGSSLWNTREHLSRYADGYWGKYSHLIGSTEHGATMALR